MALLWFLPMDLLLGCQVSAPPAPRVVVFDNLEPYEPVATAPPPPLPPEPDTEPSTTEPSPSDSAVWTEPTDSGGSGYYTTYTDVCLAAEGPPQRLFEKR